MIMDQETRERAHHHRKNRRANRLPAATCAPQNRAAAIRPTLAASPSILSNMLNALVNPTTHKTVTAPPSNGCVNGPNSVTRTPEAASQIAHPN